MQVSGGAAEMEVFLARDEHGDAHGSITEYEFPNGTTNVGREGM